MSISANKGRRLTAALLAPLALGACALGPNFRPPAPPHGQSLEAGVPAPGPSPVVAGDWWTAFGSPRLNALVEQGLKQNASLAASAAALTQAKEQTRAASGVFLPSVSLDAAQARERQTPLKSGQAGQPFTFTLNTAQTSVAYVFDVFGEERRTVEALSAQAEASRQALKGAQIMLAGNLVDAVVLVGAADEEARALRRITELDAEALAAERALAQAGRASLSNVLDAERQLDADRASLAAADQNAFSQRAALKTLVGLEPGEVLADPPPLESLAPPAPSSGVLASVLVRRRPDVREAEAVLHGATAAEGAAIAGLFPSISLTGDYGAANSQLSKLGAPVGRFWSVGPSLDLPIFSGGARWAGVKGAEAGVLKAEAAYRQTVLSALEQTSDVLRALQTDETALRAQKQAFDDAHREFELAQANFQAGLISKAQLDADEATALRARIVYLGALAARSQDCVAYFVALGGGVNEDKRP